jgi:hypothetical protein
MSIVGHCAEKLIDTISFFVAPPPPILVGPSDSIYASQNMTYSLTNYQYLDSASFSIWNGSVVYSAPDFSQFEIQWGPSNGNASFSVYAYSNGNSDTASVEVTIFGIGIDEDHLPFSIYPNPASEYIVIDATTSHQPDQYIITNMTGERIENGKLNGTQIWVNHLAAGTYFLQLRNTSSAESWFYKIQIAR